MKPFFVFTASIIFLLNLPCSGVEIKLPSLSLISGKTYEGVTLKKKNDTQASLIHASGVATVALNDLPEEVAEKLGYSREKAEAFENEQIQNKQKKEQEIANALDFKGLRLRMPLNEIPALINNTLWSYDEMEILLERVDLKNPNTSLKLSTDDEKERNRRGLFTSEQSSEFSSIGRDGVGENAFWYGFFERRALFFDGQLAQIKVYGPGWTADKLKTNTLRWLELAEAGLTQKYGKPTEVIIPISRFSILNADAGYVVYTTKWRIRNQTIYLGVSESGSRFTPMIIFYDDQLKEKMDAHAEGKPHP